MSGTDNENAQNVAPSELLLEKVRKLIGMHDDHLILNQMTLQQFCMTEKTGLVPVLIVLDDSADEIGFDFQDKQLIEQMIQILPGKMKALEDIRISPAAKANIEGEIRPIIAQFIKKPCKVFIKKFAPPKPPPKDQANIIGTSIKGQIRDSDFQPQEVPQAAESRLEAGENLLDKMDKVKKFAGQFLDLTGLLLDLRTAVHLCVTSDDKYAKVIAMGWAQTCASFKRNYRKMISDIKNEIPDFPGNEWERISATDAKLSEQIDKLIDDFNNITDRKRGIDSTMNNLRREYKTLWTRFWEVAL